MKIARMNIWLPLFFFNLCATVVAPATDIPVFGTQEKLVFAEPDIKITLKDDGSTTYTDSETGQVFVVNPDESWTTTIFSEPTGKTYRLEGTDVNDLETFNVYDTDGTKVVEPLESLMRPITRKNKLLEEETMFLRLKEAMGPRTSLGTLSLDGNVFLLRVSIVDSLAYLECRAAIRNEAGELVFLDLYVYGAPQMELGGRRPVDDPGPEAGSRLVWLALENHLE